jgi:hypothetical protein
VCETWLLATVRDDKWELQYLFLNDYDPLTKKRGPQLSAATRAIIS